MKYLVSLVLFGSNGIVAGGIALPPSQIVLVRSFLGSVLLVATLTASLAMERHHPDHATARLVTLEYPKQACALAASGAALGIGWIFLFEAYCLVGVGVSTLAYYCGPAIVMALSPLLFSERLTHAKVAGFSCVVLGAFFVVAQGGGHGVSAQGLALGGMSAVMYAAMAVFSKRAPQIRGLEAASVQLVSCFVAVLLYSILSDSVVTLGTLAQANLPAMLLLGFINTGLGCYLYFSSIGQLPVQRFAVCGYLEPLSAVVLSAAILGEPLTLGRIAGACLIIGGAAASELLGSRDIRLPWPCVPRSHRSLRPRFGTRRLAQLSHCAK